MDVRILVVGNEILSGRTADTNSGWLAGRLTALGMRVAEIRVVPDEEVRIADAVAEFQAAGGLLFVMGGIGPTHDDVTREAVARGLARELVFHRQSEEALQAHFGERCNKARRRMAQVPAGAGLLPETDSAAPGFRVEDVYVLAGIPEIMRERFEALAPHLPRAPYHTREVYCPLFEGSIAEALTVVQAHHPAVAIGSYPSMARRQAGGHPVKLALSSADAEELERTLEELRQALPLSDEDGVPRPVATSAAGQPLAEGAQEA